MKKPLFKYVSIERAKQILQNKTIRFTQSNQFNDAFELIPTLNIEHIKDVYLKKSINKKDLKGFSEFVYGYSSRIYENYSNVGTLCLSSNFDTPLMWAHYADNYSGVVIGFDPEEGLLLDSPNTTDLNNYCDIGPVNYKNERFRYPDSFKRNQLDFMFHKDKSWEYENEWRIVRSLDTLQKVNDNIFVGEFKAESVRCIIYGAETKMNDISQLNELFSKEEYKHVGQYKSYLADDTFEIDIEDLISHTTDEEQWIHNEYERTIRNFTNKMISKGVLYKAMETIDEKTEFVRMKNVIDLNTNEIKRQT